MHEPVYQRLTIIDREGALVVLLRFREDGVPFSGRISQPHYVSEGVAVTLLRLCHWPGLLAPMNLRALPQFDGSAADLFQSRRALS